MAIPNISIDDGFNIDELTQGRFDGKGVLDVILKTIGLHLMREYEEDRIRGTDYANAYINLINSTLATASEYSLAKSKQPLELQLLEANIQKVATDTIVATKQGGLLDAQIHKEMAQTEMLHLEMEHKLPKELELIDSQIKDMQANIALKEYELKYLKPKELELREKEIELRIKQLAISEKEIELKQKQIELARYELEYKAPAEVRSINAQADLYQQKVVTERAQTDNTVVGMDSVIAHNNEVLKQQAISYQNDSKIKMTSVLVDTWKIRRNDDPDEAPVNEINKLNDPNIGKVVQHTLTNIGIT